MHIFFPSLFLLINKKNLHPIKIKLGGGGELTNYLVIFLVQI
tara:strand:- start:1424 stop:1549 length:126 start_codon:yes stop_codon:yes gene_type:complete